MKERPILFSAPMVRAILDGRKTMTRRIVKPQPDEECYYLVEPETRAGIFGVVYNYNQGDSNPFVKCPYGTIGDRLWVREAFARRYAIIPTIKVERFFYRADGEHEGKLKWKPSIHMPRRSSRITLEITNIRVERLREISKEDAISEGCENSEYFNVHAQLKYQQLWESINGKGSWEANPWVWVIEFRRVL